MISDDKKKQVFEAMRSAGIDFAVFVDRESSRNHDLAYLSGHPSDAALLAHADGEMWLFPWDATLAKKHAKGVEIKELASYGGMRAAVKSLIETKAGRSDITLAFPAFTSYFLVDSFAKSLPQARILCRPDGIDRILSGIRATKTPGEIAIMEKGFAIADDVVALLPEWLESNRSKNPREIDLAFFLSREMFERGADGAREALLVANADRSSEVHQHPQAGFGPLFKPGLALIDFWMRYEGYVTDMTIPIMLEPLTAAQEEIAEIVLQVYRDTMAVIAPGAWIGEISKRSLDALRSKGLKPVGGLGHGLGLSGHDSPHLSGPPADENARRHWKDEQFAEGMVIAVEPGVVHERHGGFRLENDVIIRSDRAQIMTHAAPIRTRGI